MYSRDHLSFLWDGLLSLLYPKRCAVCGELGADVVCAQCLQSFGRQSDAVCRRCGVPLGEGDGGRGLCTDCRLLAPLHFDWARARGHYDGTLRIAIHRLKYDGRRGVAAVLGAWMREAGPGAIRLPHEPDVVLPVPLHRSRLRERGFNQSELLARAFVGDRAWPMDTKALQRIRRTRPQVSLSAEQRAENVRNAFAVVDADVVRGRHVLLVDDVLTTMHTVAECSRVLKEAGAAQVYVVAVAR